MDEIGVQAHVLFPNVAGLGAQRFLKLKEPELMLDCARAYNDFIGEWALADPDRLLPLAVVPYWDIEAAPAEIERCAAAGHRGLVFTGAPQEYDLPLLPDRHGTLSGTRRRTSGCRSASTSAAG